MSRQIAAGTANKVAHITQASLNGGNLFVFPEDVDEAHIEFLPQAPLVGLTIQLPGPDAVPSTQPAHSGTHPNDGDKYQYRDPEGLFGALHQLVIDGGGYRILGGNVGGGGSLTVPTQTGQIFGCAFTFNAELQAWVACPCMPFNIIT